MTEKGTAIITDALQMIVVQASEASIEPDEAQSAIRWLNRMMARLNSNGIRLGYTPINNLTDDITIPDGAIEGVIANLAFTLHPQYVTDELPSATLVAAAKEGMKTLRSIGMTIEPTVYPSTLPFGSGNEDLGFATDHFYPGFRAVKAELTLTGNTTETTISVIDTPVLIAGTWVVDSDINLFIGTTTGRLTYTGEDIVRLSVEGLLTGEPASGSNKTITYHLYKNGFDVNADRSVVVTASAPRKISLPWPIDMSTNDYLEFYVSNDTGTINILVSNVVFRIKE